MKKCQFKNKNKPGQALVETVLVFPVLLLLLFGIMQLALLAQAMIILNEAAHQAARAAAVGKSANLAAGYIIESTLGLNSAQGTFTGVSVSEETVPSDDYNGWGADLFSENKKVKAVDVTVRYAYTPIMYPRVFAPGTGRIPLRVTARMMKEPDAPEP